MYSYADLLNKWTEQKSSVLHSEVFTQLWRFFFFSWEVELCHKLINIFSINDYHYIADVVHGLSFLQPHLLLVALHHSQKDMSRLTTSQHYILNVVKYNPSFQSVVKQLLPRNVHIVDQRQQRRKADLFKAW